MRRFDLPVDVRYGYLGRLVVKIPWSNLMNEPVHIVIDRLFAIAVPQFASNVRACPCALCPTDLRMLQHDAVKEAEASYQAKLKHLEGFERTLKEPVSKQTDKGSGDYTAKLIAKLIDTVQVTISNVHIRYEDTSSHAATPVALGVRLEELSVRTTYADWRTDKGAPAAPSGVVFKLLSLTGLSLYWEVVAHTVHPTPQSMGGPFEPDATRAHLLPPTRAAVKVRLIAG